MLKVYYYAKEINWKAAIIWHGKAKLQTASGSVAVRFRERRRMHDVKILFRTIKLYKWRKHKYTQNSKWGYSASALSKRWRILSYLLGMGRTQKHPSRTTTWKGCPECGNWHTVQLGRPSRFTPIMAKSCWHDVMTMALPPVVLSPKAWTPMWS